MDPALSHRLADALGGRAVPTSERDAILAASRSVDVWDDLPEKMRDLVEGIESRPGWLEVA